jgi:hypothetical protein
MNNCIAAINGFNNWDNTFNYTDTNSLIIKNSLLEKIKNTKIKYLVLNEEISLFGTSMGQLYNDIDIVDKSKIIRGIWFRPKLYLLKVICKDKETGKIVIKYHVRSKGINIKYLKRLNKEQLVWNYVNMLTGEKVIYKDLTRFNRNWKQKKRAIRIKTVSETKVINQEKWQERIYEPETYR